ncbi:hypothetical protein HY405_00665 [Candidatus Microgenomates bacterium]|nr:hypothetical protein [Candidatus Microgenomates bacterium]
MEQDIIVSLKAITEARNLIKKEAEAVSEEVARNTLRLLLTKGKDRSNWVNTPSKLGSVRVKVPYVEYGPESDTSEAEVFLIQARPLSRLDISNFLNGDFEWLESSRHSPGIEMTLGGERIVYISFFQREVSQVEILGENVYGGYASTPLPEHIAFLRNLNKFVQGEN